MSTIKVHATFYAAGTFVIDLKTKKVSVLDKPIFSNDLMLGMPDDATATDGQASGLLAMSVLAAHVTDRLTALALEMKDDAPAPTQPNGVA